MPIHTWELGALLATTHDLTIAPRALSLAGALAASWLAIAIAMRLGAAPIAALSAGLVGLSAPWTVFTAWSPAVPEMPCVAWMLGSSLCLIAAASRERRTRLAILAGLLATIGCGHRYEAWFASLGFAVATVDWLRSHRRAWLAFVATMSVVPIGWIALNFARTGDPLDFVHRAVRFRSATDAIPGYASALSGLRDLVLSSGAAMIASLAGARAIRPRARPLLAGAVSVLVGVSLTQWRGGGATHHLARTYLLVVWLLVPLIAFAARNRIAHALVFATVFAQHVVGWRALPREVSRDAFDAGAALAANSAPGECYAIEIGRLDFLWIELSSRRPDDARPDRAFGASAPSSSHWLDVASTCRSAATHTSSARDALLTAGWRASSTHGGWTVLRR